MAIVQQPRSHVWAQDRPRRREGDEGREEDGVEWLGMERFGRDKGRCQSRTRDGRVNQAVGSNGVGRMSSQRRRLHGCGKKGEHKVLAAVEKVGDAG